MDPRIRLGRLVVEVCGNRSTAAEIADRLERADEEVSDQDLAMILRRLVDCGQLKQVQRQASYPMRYVSSGRHSFDETDDLAASICEVLRNRDELGYTDEDELKRWLADAGIGFDPVADLDQFNLAVGQLERLGRLQTPRTWERDDPRPTWLVDAVPYTGD